MKKSARPALSILVIEAAERAQVPSSAQSIVREKNELITFKVDVVHSLQAASQFKGCAADVILIDLFLPDAEGIGAVRTLKLQYPATPVIAVVSRGERFAALEAGAQDTLLRDQFDRRELAGAIRHAFARAQIEARLRQRELALSSAPAAIVITDENEVLQWANPAFSRLTGYNIQDLIGQPMATITGEAPPSPSDAVNLARRPRLNLPRRHNEQIHRRKDGSRFYAQCEVTPVVDSDGQPRHYVRVFRDISHRRQTERLLEAVSVLQDDHIINLPLADCFSAILQIMLEATESPMGFLGEPGSTEHGSAQGLIHAFWSDTFLPELEDPEAGRGFQMLTPLYQPTLNDSKPVIDNHPERNPELAQCSAFLNAYACLPIFSGRDMLAFVVLANHPQGYNGDLADALRPLLNACGVLLAARRSRVTLRDQQRCLASVLGNGEYSALFIDTRDRIEDHYILAPEDLLIQTPPASLRQHDYRKVFQFEFARQLSEHLAAVREQGLDVRFPYTAASGQDYNVHIHLLPEQDEAPEKYLVTISAPPPALREGTLKEEATLLLTQDLRIRAVSEALTELTGYPSATLLNEPFQLFDRASQSEEFLQGIWDCVTRYGTWQGEATLLCADGQTLSAWTTIQTTPDPENSDAILFRCSFSNNDYLYSAPDVEEASAYALAAYDPITSLPSRVMLIEKLHALLEHPHEGYPNYALLFVDIDRFKRVNDTLGHDTGDRVIQHAAQRILDNIRPHDIVARIGGDEFVVLLQELGTDNDSAQEYAELVATNIRSALAQPFHIKHQTCHVTASMGATLFTTGDGSCDVDDLFKRIGLALQRSKDGGGNASSFFTAEMQAAFDARNRLASDLRYALAVDQFRLYYQPQVDLDGQVFGAEALLRWPHPEHGMVSPAVFIPIAEETGQIIEIGNWVLRTACRQIRDWRHQSSTRHITLAVNVSALQFHHPDFIDHVLDAVTHYSVPPERLKLELTESLLVDDIEQAIHIIRTLKEHGIGFALDDFGTGYSSLSYLKRLPLDQLKIDQSFVRDILTDPSDEVIVRTIVALGRNLGLNVVAEGVETSEHLAVLARHGCTLFQGYLFGPPLPADAFNATSKLEQVQSLTHRKDSNNSSIGGPPR